MSESRPQEKPRELYHGSTALIDGPLQPILRHTTLDHAHDRAAVFATERIDIAALFMFPLDTLASIGFEKDIAYICIWGTSEEFASRDKGGFVYILPGASFEKVGKEYEWQSFSAVMPSKIKIFSSVITGMMECGAQVYFVNDNKIFDRIVAEKDGRAPILEKLISENAKFNVGAKIWPS